MTNLNAIKADKSVHHKIESVGESSVRVRVHGQSSNVSWQTLRDAATQQDPELRAAYRAMLAEAEEIALAKSPLRVVYGHDSTGVWFSAHVETTWGGLYLGHKWRALTVMAADEGGTLAHAWMAKREAEDIAARIARIAPTHPVSVVYRDV